MHTNEGSELKKQASTLDDLLDQLDSLVGQSHEQVNMYRGLLRELDYQDLSWEGPQDDSPAGANPSPNSHLSKLTTLINALRESVNKNKEMLDHFQKLI